MPSNREPTILVLTRDKEATYNTPELIGGNVFSLAFKGEGSVPEPDEIDTDADEYTGKQFISRMETLTRKLEFPFETRLTPNIAAWAASLSLGSVATTTPAGATLSRLHVIEFENAITLPSTTMWQTSPDYGDKEFPGCCVSKWSLKAAKKDWIRLACTLLTSGKENAGASLTEIAAIAETFLKSSQLDLLLGGTYSEASGVGSIADGVSKKALLADIGVEFDPGAELDWGYKGSAAQDDTISYPTGIRKSDMKALPALTVPVKLEPTTSTELDYVKDETENAMEIRVIGPEIETGYRYFLKIFIPVTRALSATKGHNKSIATADLLFHAKKDISVNDWPFVQIQVQNKQTAYLA